MIGTKSDKLAESLKVFLEKGMEWEKKPTSIPGVFIVKLPPYLRSPTRLAVEINPVDESGRLTRRRGLLIRSSSELNEFIGLFGEDKLKELLKGMDEANPTGIKRPKPEREEEIIEI